LQHGLFVILERNAHAVRGVTILLGEGVDYPPEGARIVARILWH